MSLKEHVEKARKIFARTISELTGESKIDIEVDCGEQCAMLKIGVTADETETLDAQFLLIRRLPSFCRTSVVETALEGKQIVVELLSEEMHRESLGERFRYLFEPDTDFLPEIQGDFDPERFELQSRIEEMVSEFLVPADLNVKVTCDELMLDIDIYPIPTREIAIAIARALRAAERSLTTVMLGRESEMRKLDPYDVSEKSGIRDADQTEFDRSRNEDDFWILGMSTAGF